MRPILKATLSDRSDQAARFVAASTVPISFQPGLMPRSAVDQGILTGLTMATTYAMAALLQDGIQALASLPIRRDDPGRERKLRRAGIAMNVAAIATGLAVQSAFRQRRGEDLSRASARTAGYWLAWDAVAGLTVDVLHEVVDTMGRRSGRELDAFPVAIPAAAASMAVFERSRRRRSRELDPDLHDEIAVPKAIGIGLGVTVALDVIANVERLVARTIGTTLSRVLPGSSVFWRPVGHAAALAGMGYWVNALLQNAYHKIERGAARMEPAFDAPPPSRFVSGGPESLVSYETLTKQGRRFVSTSLHPDWIEGVMGSPAAAEPIRVFVGLDSAATEEDRVALAIAELERTGAFDRMVLMVISPTGTGYANYVAVESVEYMTLGDTASVVLQYSKRPSPLSLDRVWEGKRHFKMLVDAIHARLQERAPDARPRVVAFGESLGAWTSQDAFTDEGTAGLQERGIERAIWIGTPYMSRWHQQVLLDERADVDRSLVGRFNDFGQLEALDPDVRAKLRYVMVTHDNDAVAKFGVDLLVQAPEWLGPPETRPASVPKSERYRPIESFYLTLIDMKNAANVVPGQFAAKGHDYRADLARFVREVYALPATDAQVASIEGALSRFELFRAAWIEEHDAPKPAGVGASAAPAAAPKQHAGPKKRAAPKEPAAPKERAAPRKRAAAPAKPRPPAKRGAGASGDAAKG